MSVLTETQVRRVAALLHGAGVRNSQARAELLDHCCCLVESKLADGYDFDEALRQLRTDFPPTEIRTVDAHLSTLQNQKRMKRILFIALLLLAGFGIYRAYSFVHLSPAPIVAIPGQPCLDTLPAPTASYPLPHHTEISSGFGYRMHPVKRVRRFHRGIDFRAPVGTPVYATAAGTVTLPAADGPYGIQVLLRHTDDYRTRYAHLGTLEVTPGQRVEAGTRLGTVGLTGASTAPHLHYELLRGEQAVDPLASLR